MLRPGGYSIIVDPDPPRGTPATVECDTFTCAHCQRVTFVPPRASPTELGGWCGPCGQPICGACANLGTCLPWEKAMEKMEARARFLRSAGLG